MRQQVLEFFLWGGLSTFCIMLVFFLVYELVFETGFRGTLRFMREEPWSFLASFGVTVIACAMLGLIWPITLIAFVQAFRKWLRVHRNDP